MTQEQEHIELDDRGYAQQRYSDEVAAKIASLDPMAVRSLSLIWAVRVNNEEVQFASLDYGLQAFGEVAAIQALLAWLDQREYRLTAGQKRVLQELRDDILQDAGTREPR